MWPRSKVLTTNSSAVQRCKVTIATSWSNSCCCTSTETFGSIFKQMHGQHGWLRPGPHFICKYWGQSVQRGRVCACVKLSLSVSVVCWFFFKGSCASLQVGPLDRSSPLTAQMRRPRGVHVLFTLSVYSIRTRIMIRLHQQQHERRPVAIIDRGFL